MAIYERPITTLHFEPTSECNARCPQCLRTYHQSLETHPLLNIRHWNPEDLGRVLTDPLFAHLKTAWVNGNFGDIVMHPQPRELILKFVERGIFTEVYTNGSAQRPDFWQWLGRRPKLRTFFAIDGLEDTHHLYRRKTNYRSILRNAGAYIEAGGDAIWVMNLFKHNMHQAEESRSLAKEMGFTHFLVRPSTRYPESRMALVDSNFDPEYTIEPVPSDTELVPYGFSREQYELGKTDFEKAFGRDVWQFDRTVKAKIECRVAQSDSIFLSFDGRLWPCCWTASGFEMHRVGAFGDSVFHIYEDLFKEDPDFNSVIKHSPSLAYERVSGFQRIANTLDSEKPCTSCYWACKKTSEFGLMLAKESVETFRSEGAANVES
jgi:MoaA/NifB/PqqE/SkfB family radical SAM enzyme